MSVCGGSGSSSGRLRSSPSSPPCTAPVVDGGRGPARTGTTQPPGRPWPGRRSSETSDRAADNARTGRLSRQRPRRGYGSHTPNPRGPEQSRPPLAVPVPGIGATAHSPREDAPSRAPQRRPRARTRDARAPLPGVRPRRPPGCRPRRHAGSLGASRASLARRAGGLGWRIGRDISRFTKRHTPSPEGHTNS